MIGPIGDGPRNLASPLSLASPGAPSQLVAGPHAALGVLQRQKQSYFFRQLDRDRDRDGQIHWQDFERYGRQAAALQGLTSDNAL